MASKNVTSAASSQYMLEVHMSTIYHKGGISLAQPSPLYSVRNEIILAPKKAMAPFKCKWKMAKTMKLILGIFRSAKGAIAFFGAIMISFRTEYRGLG